MHSVGERRVAVYVHMNDSANGAANAIDMNDSANGAANAIDASERDAAEKSASGSLEMRGSLRAEGTFTSHAGRAQYS
jgi:hypothetical protein